MRAAYVPRSQVKENMECRLFSIFGFFAIIHYPRTLWKSHFQTNSYIPCKIGLAKSVVGT
jgi:hypothetical protein